MTQSYLSGFLELQLFEEGIPAGLPAAPAVFFAVGLSGDVRTAAETADALLRCWTDASLPKWLPAQSVVDTLVAEIAPFIALATAGAAMTRAIDYQG